MYASNYTLHIAYVIIRLQNGQRKMRRVYADNSATTALSKTARAAFIKALDLYGNASSLHSYGHGAMMAVEAAREQVAKLIGAKPHEIVFNSGGTEGNNTVIGMIQEGEVIVSSIEHPSVLEAVKRQRSQGVVTHYLPVNKDGRVEMSELKKVLNKKTQLVSVMTANNEIGTLQDVAKIVKIAHEKGALVHTDAVQAAGKIPLDVRELGVDYLTLSAHKIGGPKGVGAMYVREGVPYVPFLVGGYQEGARRAGTYNVPGIVGFGEAAKEAVESPRLYAKRVALLRNELRERILDEIPNVVVNGSQEKILPHVLNVSFAGAEGESILLMLDEVGIEVSTGSACASGDTSPSHVLMAVEADPELAHGSIRFSLSLDNETGDIDYIMEHLPRIIKKLRAISTVGEGNGK